MKILIGALDWGLGHTTRIIPIIDHLLKEGHTIILGAGKNQINIYKEHFPDLILEKLPNANPIYFGKKTQFLSVLIFIPKFLFSIWSEKQYVKKLIKKHNIEKIISDNRYGLYNSNTINIIITHQLSLIPPKPATFLSGFINRKIADLINHFDECHIPDHEGQLSLSGKLSIPSVPLKCLTKHIGPLSRLTLINTSSKEEYPELLILISGPENQRTWFEKNIRKALKKNPKPLSYHIVRGLPYEPKNKIPNSSNHLEASDLKAYINHAKYIICRSGYSTIMDLVLLKKTAMLIPTPGQTEQIYLASYLEKKQWFLKTSQDKINILEIVQRLDTFVPAPLP